MTWNLSIPSRRRVIDEQRSKGGGVAAIFPIHYPRALFSSLDVLPVEVWGPPAAKKLKHAHLPSYTCSIVTQGLSFILEGGLNDVDFIIVPHGCDTLQGLGSILQQFIPNTKPVLPLYVPRGRGEVHVEFFARELSSLCTQAADLVGKAINEQKLKDAIDAEDRATDLEATLLKNRAYLSATNREFYHLLRSREYLPAQVFSELAEQALDNKGVKQRAGEPILLSGVVPEPMEILDLLEELGATVVADDCLSTGRRIYPPSKRVDSFSRMAESILMGPPDSTRGSSFEDRAAFVLNSAKQCGVRGAIFLGVKFCEPEQFYLPALLKRFKDEGIPTLALEVSLGEPLSNQLVTRIEAFMETFL